MDTVIGLMKKKMNEIKEIEQKPIKFKIKLSTKDKKNILEKIREGKELISKFDELDNFWVMKFETKKNIAEGTVGYHKLKSMKDDNIEHFRKMFKRYEDYFNGTENTGDGFFRSFFGKPKKTAKELADNRAKKRSKKGGKRSKRVIQKQRRRTR